NLIPGDRDTELALADAVVQRDKARADANQQMVAAREALQLGQLEAARLLFRKAADLAPDGSEEQRDDRRHADHLVQPPVVHIGTEANRLIPDNARAIEGLREARYGRAIEDGKKARLDADSLLASAGPTNKLTEAKKAALRRNYDPAIRAFEDALREKPGDP